MNVSNTDAAARERYLKIIDSEVYKWKF
jgi:hypothetical protein